MEGSYVCSIQPLEIWGGGFAPQDMLNKHSLETFVIEDPLKADIITIKGARVTRWKDIKVWQSEQSDVEGCLTVHTPISLSARRTSVLDSNAPVLQLIDRLVEAGFVPQAREAVHRPESPLVFDNRLPAARRAYFQCVLERGKLWPKGVTDFDSLGSQAYYKALMGCKDPVRTGLTAVEYKRLLDRHRNQDIVVVEGPPWLVSDFGFKGPFGPAMIRQPCFL